jgi:prepilin-type N-terminal cleavage/methylation domain-containing protein
MEKNRYFQAGFTLIEVLVGILIFALGMMALAQLQGNLSKSSADSNARTVAINIAEETVEALRSFSQVTASTTADAFNNIVSGTETVQRGGIDYTLTSTVTDYYYNPTNGGFQTNKPDPDIVNADVKRLELTVAWGAGQNFQIDETTPPAGLGTGSITLVDLISSFTTSTGPKVILNAVTGLYAPPVDYNPGQNPDIVSIQLGNNKFKESTTPLPDVIRAEELVETRFDVVTYSQNDLGATFLRREEFRAVSCECTLRASTSATQGGLRPTIWEGAEYSEGEFVAKPYGVSASQVQSIYCDQCCRDHHDGGTGANDVAGDPGRSRFDPFRAAGDYHTTGAFVGDHKHYNRDRTGALVLAANDGDRYVEACRFVRKDGFFRVAQDLRQEGLNAFPEDYLDDNAELDEYSDYVTDAVSGYEAALEDVTDPYERNPPDLTQPQYMEPAVVFPASTPGNPTQMRDGAVSEQQLRSRGIYLDYMSDALRVKIDCLDGGGTGPDCDVPDVTTALEIIPFYDVQLTWLARWNETPNNNPIDVSNEAIADDNTHSRGVAVLTSGYNASNISSAVHSGNLGLTGTDPIDPRYGSNEATYNLYAFSVDYDTPPVLSGVVVKGTITSSVAGVKAADIEIEATGAQCDRTNTGFECVLVAGATTPRLKIFNYYKPNTVLVGCSVNGNLSIHGSEIGANGWTRFNLPLTETLDADIVIRSDNC